MRKLTKNQKIQQQTSAQNLKTYIASFIALVFLKLLPFHKNRMELDKQELKKFYTIQNYFSLFRNNKNPFICYCGKLKINAKNFLNSNKNE